MEGDFKEMGNSNSKHCIQDDQSRSSDITQDVQSVLAEYSIEGISTAHRSRHVDTEHAMSTYQHSNPAITCTRSKIHASTYSQTRMIPTYRSFDSGHERFGQQKVDYNMQDRYTENVGGFQHSDVSSQCSDASSVQRTLYSRVSQQNRRVASYPIDVQRLSDYDRTRWTGLLNCSVTGVVGTRVKSYPCCLNSNSNSQVNKCNVKVKDNPSGCSSSSCVSSASTSYSTSPLSSSTVLCHTSSTLSSSGSSSTSSLCITGKGILHRSRSLPVSSGATCKAAQQCHTRTIFKTEHLPGQAPVQNFCTEKTDAQFKEVLSPCNVKAKIQQPQVRQAVETKFLLPFEQDSPVGRHDQLNRKNSNGSIGSYRSSNEDSAIDLLTPEEELDTQYFIDCDINQQTESVDWFSSAKAKFSAASPKLKSPPLDESVFVQNLELPSVVISDHSEPCKELEGVAMMICNDGSQDSGTAVLLGGLERQTSNVSISSEDSLVSSSGLSCRSDSVYSLSDVSDMDDAPTPPVVKKKQSSWRKIRNIVHWSPFIQQFKKHRYPWIQLAGHQGNFQAGEPGAILKKFDPREQKAFVKLMKDILRPYVPEYRGDVTKNNDKYLQLQDLLCEFETPCVMDVKMGTRTYLEEELEKAREKPKLRKDMYQKMIEVDPDAPTPEEHEQKAIIKPRYMQWRDDMSSSVSLGFRIEGIKKMDGASSKNFKKTRGRDEVKESLKIFIENQTVLEKYIRRLKAIKATQEASEFFNSQEIIGSSLLFVHDNKQNANIWMIDFGKTVPIPKNSRVDHRSKWVEGNHEDGYLFGLDSMLSILEELVTVPNEK